MSTHRRRLRPALVLIGATAVTAVLTSSYGSSAPARAAGSLPPVGHVWTIMLENSDFLETFAGGQSTNPYIGNELPKLGVLIPNYFGTGHSSLDNYITMVSGQAPNTMTQNDCHDPSVLGKGEGSLDADGQWLVPRDAVTDQPDQSALGCTFPTAVKTLPDQFREHGISWKGYMEDVDARPAILRTTCQYPGSGPKPGQDPSTYREFSNYAQKHDPFIYFHTITDDVAYCDAHDVALPQLDRDLQSIDTTPQWSYITPNQCNDAHNDTCDDGGSGGLTRADEWAKIWIPKILASPAYKKDGLIILTVDEGSEVASCCNEPRGPNLPITIDNGSPQYDDTYGTVIGRGGGQIGTVMISPFITPGGVDLTGTYNHYSYLRSMEDLFGIGATADIPGSDGHGHLGYAGTNAGLPPVTSYGTDVFTGDWSSGPSPSPSTPSPSPPYPTPATASPAPTAAQPTTRPRLGPGPGLPTVRLSTARHVLPAGSRVRFRGTVTRGGVPMVGRLVYLSDRLPDSTGRIRIATARTDRHGRFRFEVVLRRSGAYQALVKVGRSAAHNPELYVRATTRAAI